MKKETVLIVAVILSLAGIGGMAAFNTHIGTQQDQIAEQKREILGLEEQVAGLQEQLLPEPYHPPLEQAWVSSGCGYRTDPMGGGTEGLHKGVDLVGARGSPIVAVLAGVVVEHWPSPNSYWRGHPIYGGLVVIDHGEGLFSLYGHLADTCVHEGWWVEAGQPVGELGDTGITTGPHLHFEVVVDPLRYLEDR